MTAHRAANGPTDLRAAEQELRAEIDAQRPGSMRIVGFTLYLRAAVDYFYAYKGSRAYWDGFLRKQRNIKAQLEQSGEDPGLLEMTNRMIDEIPLKREQWIKTIAKWGEIRNAALSDAALNASCPFVFM
jgi:hypothetical protein